MRWMILALLPGMAAAESWQGVWAADPAWCAYEVGEGDPSPVQYTASRFEGLETGCDIAASLPLSDTGATYLELECSGEGSVWQVNRVLMVAADGQRMWTWFGDGTPVEFSRCE